MTGGAGSANVDVSNNGGLAVRHGIRPIALLGMVLVVVVAGCGTGVPVDSDGHVVVNNGWPDQLDVQLIAGEHVREPHRTVSFGTGTIENVGEADVTIVGVAPLETFGGIEPVGAIVKGPDRDTLWISSDDQFPPREGPGTTAPAIGYVVPPSDETLTPEQRTVNLVHGYRVPPSSAVAGVLGFCVSYRVEGIPGERRLCWPNHWLLACEDVDDPACVAPEP